MRRPDDCSLTPGQRLRVRKEAERAEAENEELKKAISKPWMGSARAAYLGKKE
jgi:hypothetical protein